MTFSLSARDPRTGAFGMLISSSSPAVASRCLHLRPGVGVAASQNVTNPSLGPRVLDRLASGLTAQEAVNAVIAEELYAQHRQVVVIDVHGRAAVHSGRHSLGINAVAIGEQAAAAGNLLASDDVPRAMLDAYASSTSATFEERLLDGFRGAIAAGGEAGPIRSAGLAVVEDAAWRVTDLRVDDHDDPGAELARLLDVWLPQKEAYLTRALHPEDAPSYGVPGDL